MNIFSNLQRFRAYLKIVVAGLWPAVESGILPPGPVAPFETARSCKRCRHGDVFPAGLEARLYVSQDGRPYIFRRGLTNELQN